MIFYIEFPIRRDYLIFETRACCSTFLLSAFSCLLGLDRRLKTSILSSSQKWDVPQEFPPDLQYLISSGLTHSESVPSWGASAVLGSP